MNVEEAKSGRFQKVSGAFKHPLVLLLIGTLLGSLIIPYLKERETRRSELATLRLQKAFAAFNANQEVDADLNGVITGFENLLKARVHTLDPDRDHDLQKQIYAHHTAFNRDAWWWFPRLITETQLFGVLDPGSVSEARLLADKYDKNLVAATKTLEPLWFFMESKPVLSPPDRLSDLLNQIHESNKKLTEDRLTIVNAFGALLLKQSSEGRKLNSSKLPPNPGPQADGYRASHGPAA